MKSQLYAESTRHLVEPLGLEELGLFFWGVGGGGCDDSPARSPTSTNPANPPDFVSLSKESPGGCGGIRRCGV